MFSPQNRLITPEEAPEEADKGLGRGSDGRIRRQLLIIDYKEGRRHASLFARMQVPLAVRRLTSKQLTYRKRLTLKRQVGDKMLGRAEIEEVPSVETLMDSPLSRFIHFAVNDCCYSGTWYELIAIWMHPLFPKAKSGASKEDNPNWRQAMNDPFKEEYWNAELAA